MTDQFIKPTENKSENFVPADQQGADPQNQSSNTNDQQGGGDNHDPAYQVGVMQKRINDKDEYIRTLQAEAQAAREAAADLEEKMQNSDRVNEALDRIGNQRGNTQEQPSLDEDALVGKIEQRLTEKQKEQQRTQNFDAVQARLLKEYGDAGKANASVEKAASESGLSTQALIDMAKESPKAFYKLVGVDAPQQQAPTGQPTRSNQLSDGSDTGVVKDRAYFARMRRENPRQYWKTSTQAEFRKLFN